MQQHAVLRLLVVAILVSALAACGGGDNENQIGEPATVTLSPTTATLTRGDSVAINVLVQDANGNTNRAAPVTFTSSNPAVASVFNRVNQAGETFASVCAGTWDTAGIVCTP